MTARPPSSITPPQGVAAPRRRVRTLLKNFYGVGKEDESAQEGELIDQSNFDADKYVEHLMRGASMSQLIQKDELMMQGYRRHHYSV